MVTEVKKISRLAGYMRNQQELDLDNFVIVSAPKGFGKSNLTLYAVLNYLVVFGFKCPSCSRTWVTKQKVLALADETRAKLWEKCPRCNTSTRIGISWNQFEKKDLWKYIAYSDDIYEKIMKIDNFSPIAADEGVNFAMGEDWMYTSNKKIKRLFAQCRTKNLIIFLNIPKFSWIQSKYRDDMATSWFRILTRGLCLMMIPDLGEHQDSWHIKEFEQILGNYNVQTPLPELKKKIQKLQLKHPCFYDAFWVPKVPDKIYKMYKEVRDYYVYQNKDQEVDATNLHKLIAYNLRYRWKLLLEESKGRPYPSARMLAEFVFFNPLKGKPAVSEQVIKNNVGFMKKMLKEKLR